VSPIRTPWAPHRCSWEKTALFTNSLEGFPRRISWEALWGCLHGVNIRRKKPAAHLRALLISPWSGELSQLRKGSPWGGYGIPMGYSWGWHERSMILMAIPWASLKPPVKIPWDLYSLGFPWLLGGLNQFPWDLHELLLALPKKKRLVPMLTPRILGERPETQANAYQST